MARKKYIIDFTINSGGAEGSAKRVSAALKDADKYAQKFADSMTRAYGVSGRAGQSSAQQIAQAQTQAAGQAVKVQQAAAQKIDIGLQQLQVSAIKFGDAQRAAAEKAATAQKASVASQVVSLSKLQASGLDLQSKLAQAQAKRLRDEDRLHAKSLSDEQVALKVRNTLIADSNKARVDAALQAAKVERGLIKENTDGYGKMATAIIAAQLATRALIDLAHTAGQAVTDAGLKSQKLTAGFIADRDSLGELASVMDRPLDNKFSLDIARYNVKTGFKPEEGRSFLNELYNSGAQHVGRHISEEQFEKYKVLAGQFAVQTHIDPQVVGDLAGNILASTDFSKYGDKAAQEALAKLNATYQIGKRGRGGNATLLTNFVKSASVLLRENREEGIMTSPENVMAGISVMAERNPNDAETFLRHASQGLRKLDDKKAGPLLKEAGITLKDDPFQAAAKLSPVLKAEAARRGEGTRAFDILGEMFNEREAQGIATLVGRGVDSGVIKDRLEYGKQFSGPDAALRLLSGQAGSEAFRSRQADAEIRLAELERGSEVSKLDVVRRQALSGLVRRKEIDTNASNVKDYLVGKTSFGLLGSGEQVRIDEEAQRLLQRVTPKGAKPAPWSDMLNFTPLAREQDLSRQLGRAEDAGVDPIREIGKLLTATEETNRLLQEQLNIAKQAQARQGGGNQIARPAPPLLPLRP